MAILRNNANGGVNGTTIGYYNCGDGSGDQWGYIYIGAGSTATFSNEVGARGGMSYKFTTNASSNAAYMLWDRAPNLPDTYVRFSIYLPSYASASFRPCELDDGISTGFSIGITNTGRISIRDSASASMILTTTSVPIGRWARIEVHLTSHATNGQATVRLYREVDSPYVTETVTSAATFNTKPNAAYLCNPRFGISSAAPSMTCYIDDIVVDNQAWPGPGDPAFVPPTTVANNAEMGSNGVAANPENTASTGNNFLTLFSNPGSVTFSNAQASHGSLSYAIQAASGADSIIRWPLFATPSMAARMYIYFTALPSANTEFMQLTTHEAGTFEYAGRIAFHTSGAMLVFDNSGLKWTSTATASINTWYRVEMYCVPGASSTGTISAAFYALDSLTALDSYSTSTANTGALQTIGLLRFGKVTSTAMTSTFYVDGIAAQAQASGFIGPYSGPLTPPATFAGIIPHLGWGRKI